jgi:hypothetical protein
MRNRIEIEFEKGGKFIAALLEDKAPKTCKIVWQNLPLSGKIGHGIYSGKLMYLIVNTGFDELENARSMGLLPGDIAYQTRFYGRDTHNEILIVYGDAIVRDVCGWTPANYFAKIVEGSLEELKNVAIRVRESGREEITIRKQIVNRR